MIEPLLYEEAPPDVEDIVVAWLTPLRAATAITYRSGDPLPFTLVMHIGGGESFDESTADHLVQVSTLCDRRTGWIAARNESNATHRRMLQLANLLEPFTLSDGTGIGVDYCTVLESPLWHDSENEQILMRSGRYLIGLMYSPIE